jgi:UrcA family protein
MKRTLCALAVAVSVVLAPPARANPSRESVVVRTGDIDPSTEPGARIMMRRIDHAADLVCGASFARLYLSARRNFRRCHELTVAAAVNRIDTPALHALHGLRPHI